MNFSWLWHRAVRSVTNSNQTVEYDSLLWLESELFPGVEFSIRKISLSKRLEFSSRIRDLTIQNEFLRAGQPADQLEAKMADLLVQKLYLEWAIVDLAGLSIDGQDASIELLINRGPEALVYEIAEAIRTHLELSEGERKNF